MYAPFSVYRRRNAPSQAEKGAYFMKKGLLFAVASLMLFTAFLTVACEKTETIGATVLAVNENGIMVEPDEGTNARTSADKIFFSCKNAADFAAGDRVQIVFNGVIAESYPGQAVAKSVELLENIAIPID
jgi:hypothetical protein